MRRRAALVGTGTMIAAGAGCLDRLPLVDGDETRIDDPPAALDTAPSLSFERLGIPPYGLPTADTSPTEQSYHVAVVTSADDLDEVFRIEELRDDDRKRLDEIDLGESVLVAVASGPDSSSVSHRWARVEAVDDGLHLHGAYTDPDERTDDLSPVRSTLEIERPDETVDLARVSLTVDGDRRVHFDSTEGIVTTDD